LRSGETVNDQLKNICQIEHMRPRNVAIFVVNLLACIDRLHLSGKETISQTSILMIWWL
jgi:hypothetical protein